MDTSSEQLRGSPLDVLILSYDSAAVIDRLLASLALLLPDAPVAIREHSDAPGALERLQYLVSTHSAPVRVSVDTSNPGFGAGCNALAVASTADHLLFLNPDTELVAWPYDVHPPPTDRLVGPMMVDSGDPSRHYGIRYKIRDEIARSWLRRSSPQPAGVGFVSGAAMMIARADFERIGGFDEQYFLFYEDIDLCLRANDAGVGTFVDPDFRVRHAGAHSTSGRFGASLIWSYESAVRFHRTHGSSVSAYRAYVTVDAVLRAIAAAIRGRRREQVAAYGALAKRALADAARSARSFTHSRPPTQCR